MPGSGRVLVVLFYGLIFLYEPLLVWGFGATIGQRARTGLRVVDDATGGNPPFWRAFVRFVLKTVLGLPSGIAIAFTRRHQALRQAPRARRCRFATWIAPWRAIITTSASRTHRIPNRRPPSSGSRRGIAPVRRPTNTSCTRVSQAADWRERVWRGRSLTQDRPQGIGVAWMMHAAPISGCGPRTDIWPGRSVCTSASPDCRYRRTCCRW